MWVISIDGKAAIVEDVDGEHATARIGDETVRLPRQALLLRPIDPPTARALIEQLAVPADPGEAVPLAEGMAARDAQIAAASPAMLVDWIRISLARREGVPFGLEWVMRNLAVSAGRPIAEVEYTIARGHGARGPAVLRGHGYVGSFVTAGDVKVCDPCYLGEGLGRLAVPLEVSPGRYHVWIGWSNALGLPATLVCTHEAAIEILEQRTTKLVARVANDAAALGVFDESLASDRNVRDLLRDDVDAWKGIVRERGAYADTAGGGIWRVGVQRVGGRIVCIKLSLDGSDVAGPVVLTTRPPGRPYSPRERYTPGERVAHPSFGVGRVVESRPGKIDVLFVDTTRTLVQGRA